ncbi:peroxiredoxin family protein [Natronolimnobius sp. AArcel1]|uniref:redoxin domain-containing protein n=1 Tax=Natronolimnobius sp. AArcel1 TaxID=1679093 RepID=UPI0013ECCF40|nr:redoxin domain-containing protein [Natronolimnobius sp. AArcel1]NGM68725.1 peroxiredoxin family protein [Natronolimnobius sp. AArcel1]
MTNGARVALANVGPGPDTLTLAELADPVEPVDPTTTEEPDPAYEAVVVLLHRDHHCGQCRRQVRAVADRYDEFRDRGCQVVSIVPEPRERVEEWQETYDLPFPICADPDAVAGEAFDQPVRLGTLGEYFDFVGRMPAALVFNVRSDDVARLGAPDQDSSEAQLTLTASHRGRTTMDRPDIDDLLATVDRQT